MLKLLGNLVDTVYEGTAAVPAVEVPSPMSYSWILECRGWTGTRSRAAARAIAATGRLMIAITGWGGETDRPLSRDAGLDRHLVKPVVPSELLAVLESFGQVAPS